MKLLKEFQQFAMKGNVVDLATAVIIGGAFGKIVSSLVADIVMPLIGLLLGGFDFTDWRIVLRPASEGQDALTMNIGAFIQNIVDFLIIAASIFLMIRILMRVKDRFRRKEEEKPAPPPEPSLQEKLLIEIRDILKNKQ